MKPGPFIYARAESAEHAVELLEELGEDARILAGGQSLVPMMALRLSRPEALVDITRCPDLHRVDIVDGQMSIGAAVTARTVERDADVVMRHPLLVRALEEVGHPEIRARGTICGSLAHADPAAEMPALLLATDGMVTVEGPAGRRQVGAEDFLMGPFTTTLEEGELVVEAHFPVPPDARGWAIEELTRRHGDFAAVGVICLLDADADGTCIAASLTLFGVAGQPIRAAQSEAALIGTRLATADVESSAGAVLDGISINGDLHGSVAYRRSVASVLARRAVERAWARTSVNQQQGPHT